MKQTSLILRFFPAVALLVFCFRGYCAYSHHGGRNAWGVNRLADDRRFCSYLRSDSFSFWSGTGFCSGDSHSVRLGSRRFGAKSGGKIMLFFVRGRLAFCGFYVCHQHHRYAEQSERHGINRREPRGRPASRVPCDCH